MRYPLPFSFRRARVFSALLLTLLAGAGGGIVMDGRVISVPDGDTLVVFTTGGKERVRLYGVDCPELRQRGGRDARDFTESLAMWEKVSLLQMDTDAYGRPVVIVTLPDGRVLNGEVVARGQAWVYRAYCRDSRCGDWLAREKTAREQFLGLWGEANPTPPWRWRQSNHR